eukprot:scpid57233/ scgid30916/ 
MDRARGKVEVSQRRMQRPTAARVRIQTRNPPGLQNSNPASTTISITSTTTTTTKVSGRAAANETKDVVESDQQRAERRKRFSVPMMLSRSKERQLDAISEEHAQRIAKIREEEANSRMLDTPTKKSRQPVMDVPPGSFLVGKPCLPFLQARQAWRNTCKHHRDYVRLERVNRSATSPPPDTQEYSSVVQQKKLEWQSAAAAGVPRCVLPPAAAPAKITTVCMCPVGKFPELRWDFVVRQFPLGVDVRRITFLCLNKQAFRSIPPVLVECVHLSTLLLGNNRIRTIRPGVFHRLCYLKALSLNNNKLCNVANIVSELTLNPCLRSLNLLGNPCLKGDDWQKNRKEIVKDFPLLTVLNGQEIAPGERKYDPKRHTNAIRRFTEHKHYRDLLGAYHRYDDGVAPRVVSPPTEIFLDPSIAAMLCHHKVMTRKGVETRIPTIHELKRLLKDLALDNQFAPKD